MAEPQPTENWKPVVGYEGIYEVSDQGRVRSVDRIASNGTQRKGRVLAPKTLNHGHLRVTLSDDGVRAQFLIHRLVLGAFVGPCPDGMEACHENDDPQDNRLENLRWDTRANNNHDRVRNGIHPMSVRTHCRYGHPLERRNLVTSMLEQGRRSCLACSRARAACQHNPALDRQATSDRYYAAISNL